MFSIKRGIPRKSKSACTRRGGFTLVELLLVLVILATLAAIVVPKFTGRSKQAKVTAAQTQISSFEVGLDNFEVDNGFYPKGADGLMDLVENPEAVHYMLNLCADFWVAYIEELAPEVEAAVDHSSGLIPCERFGMRTSKRALGVPFFRRGCNGPMVARFTDF